jgi:class 3 adenylate cyclase/pimeloyl-ACP methyl ester carboxylesterase
MPNPSSHRKLAAVLAADIVGYSRLMGEDEVGTLVSVKRVFEDVVGPVVEAFEGHIVKSMGDGYLVEFDSTTNSVSCALNWQKRARDVARQQPTERQIVFRIGINLGEIHFEDGDILGDGVNIAARLESICPPGGICVSEMIKNTTGSDLDVQFDDFGFHRLKNIKVPVHTYLAAQSHLIEVKRAPGPRISRQSTVRYCLSKDGASIAHATVGEGYPLVFAGSWMTHLEWDWESPSYRDYLSHLSKHFRVIRYDQRGNGMSDWDNVDITFEKMVDDMECVIDQYDHEKVAIMGMSQGASVAIAYMKRQPDKVSHLVLNGGYARGRRRRGSAKDQAESEALVNMIRYGWATENPAFRQTVTTLFMPGASPEEANWFNAFQKACGPGENMARIREMFDEMDVSDSLGDIKAPTLIIHSDEDAIAPCSEGKYLAARIPGAQFVQLKSKNHMMFGNEPDFPKLITSIVDFVK